MSGSPPPARDGADRRGLIVTAPGAAPAYAVAGDAYTILVAGRATAGRHAVVDMLVPRGGGPQPHRHGFEESFVVPEGQVEVFSGGPDAEPLLAPRGAVLNVPAWAPHTFRNPGPGPARMLCVVAPAGLEELFAAAGDRLAGGGAAPPPAADRGERDRRAAAVAARVGVEMLAGDSFARARGR